MGVSSAAGDSVICMKPYIESGESGRTYTHEGQYNSSGKLA